jgi:chromosome segregation ATPase
MIVELSPLEGNNRRLEEDLIKQKDQTDAWKEECTVQERLANEAIKQREGLENKIALLSSEIERLRVKVDNRAAEIELQKMQIQELQEHLTDAQQLSGVVNELQSKVNVLGVERDQIVDQYNARIKELNELRNRYHILNNQLLAT